MWNGVDRRKFPRAEYPCLITIRKYTPPPVSILSHTENISEGGVRVIIDHRIDINTEVDLEIDLKDALPNISSRGTIRWVKEVASKESPVPDAKENVKVLKGSVSWVEEIPPARKGLPARFDTGIQFLGLKADDKRRISELVDILLGKGGDKK
ncbi:MAG: PilZ domain-containing protein [Candidatus Omnitrophica bacterium]|nr:PilZ domain-containing protein [Candidatus Omnitrophota bacterium]